MIVSRQHQAAAATPWTATKAQDGVKHAQPGQAPQLLHSTLARALFTERNAQHATDARRALQLHGEFAIVTAVSTQRNLPRVGLASTRRPHLNMGNEGR